MAEGLFVTPSIRRAGRPTRVTHSLDVGTAASWPGQATTAAIDGLLTQLSGVIRGLHLAGYGVPTVRLEANGTQLEVRLPSRTAGAHPVQPDDGLAPVRTPAQFKNALFIAVEAKPLELFGPAAKLNLARPLGSPNHVDVRQISNAPGAWIVVRCSSLGSDALNVALLDVAHLLETPITGRWNTVPAAGSNTPTGASFILDRTRWNYPPADATGRLSGAGAHIDLAWKKFCSSYITGPNTDRDEWLGDELEIEITTPSLYERLFGKTPQFPVSEAQDAYERRLAEVGRFLDPAHLDTASGMKKLAATDVIMTMIEHGIVDPFQSIALRATPETPPEWTTPCLTGTWGATTGTNDVVLINQAGRYLEGYLNRRVPANPTGHAVESWAFSVEMTTGPGAVQEFTGKAYKIDSSESNNDNSWMSLAELEAHATGTPATIGTDTVGGSTRAYFSLTGSTTYDRAFTLAHLNAHISNQLLNTTGATAAIRSLHGPPPYPGAGTTEPVPVTQQRRAVDAEPRRIRRNRSRALHPAEEAVAANILRALLGAALDWSGASGVARLPFITVAEDAITTHLGDEYGPVGPVTDHYFSAVAHAIGQVVRAELQSQSESGGWNSLQTLLLMTNTSGSKVLSRFLAIGSVGTSSAQFFYEWKLTDVVSRGGQVFAGGAFGVGTIHFRRVENGVATELPSMPIHLYTFALSSSPGPEFGMDNVPNWTPFDFPADHDLAAHLGNGASMNFTSPLNLGLGPLASNAPTDVTLSPSDRTMNLQGTVSGNLIAMPIYLGLDSARHDDQVGKWKDGYRRIYEGISELTEQGTKLGSRLGKAASRFKPSFGGYTTYGSIGAPLTGTAPLASHITSPQDFGVGSGVVSLFPSGLHTLDQQHLRSFRQFLAGYLALLTGPFGGVTAVGHASNLGPTASNLTLSERRAVSVIEAVRNILGPQLGVPATDIQAIGLGESQASGGPNDNRPSDRRTDLTLEGVVTLRL